MGAAMLAQLHFGLRKLKKQKIKNFRGNSMMLQIAALIRLPKLAQKFYGFLDALKIFPLMNEWVGHILRKCHDSMNRLSIYGHKKELIGVTKKPYVDITGTEEAPLWHLDMCFKSTYIMCIDKLWKYDATRFTEQLNFPGPILEAEAESSRKKKRKLPGKCKRGLIRDWLTDYQEYVTEWMETCARISPDTEACPSSTEEQRVDMTHDTLTTDIPVADTSPHTVHRGETSNAQPRSKLATEEESPRGGFNMDLFASSPGFPYSDRASLISSPSQSTTHNQSSPPVRRERGRPQKSEALEVHHVRHNPRPCRIKKTPNPLSGFVLNRAQLKATRGE